MSDIKLGIVKINKSTIKRLNKYCKSIGYVMYKYLDVIINEHLDKAGAEDNQINDDAEIRR